MEKEIIANELATKILRFFYVDINQENIQPKTVNDFVDSIPGAKHGLNLNEMAKICSVFEQRGLLMSGGVEGHSILGKSYLAANFNEMRAAYGEYEFIAHGFSLIRERLGGSVRAVVVTKKNGDKGIGTCFLIGNSHTIVTAKHVVENMKEIKILGNGNRPVKVINISIPEYDKLDLALLVIADQAFQGIPPLRATNHNILDEVLCMGYPPIPGFHDVQIADIANINSEIKSSKGKDSC